MTSGRRHSSDELSLSELKRRYENLRLPPMRHLSDEDNRQRFLYLHYMLKMMRRSAICVAISALSVICVVSVNNISFNSFVRSKIALYAWPWNFRFIDQASQASGYVVQNDTDIFVTVTSVVSTIWLLWLIINSCMEMTRRDYWNIPIPVWFLILSGVICWYASGVGILSDVSTFGPSMRDPIMFAAFKEAVLIAGTYWWTGMCLSFLASRVRTVKKSKATI